MDFYCYSRRLKRPSQTGLYSFTRRIRLDGVKAGDLVIDGLYAVYSVEETAGYRITFRPSPWRVTYRYDGENGQDTIFGLVANLERGTFMKEVIVTLRFARDQARLPGTVLLRSTALKGWSTSQPLEEADQVVFDDEET